MIQSATRTDRAKCPRRPSKSHQIGGFHSTTPKKCGIHARHCHAPETHMYITRGLGHNDTLTLSDSSQTYVSFTKKEDQYLTLSILLLSLTMNYASWRAPSLMTTGITTGSCPYFSANADLAFWMNAS